MALCPIVVAAPCSEYPASTINHTHDLGMQLAIMWYKSL